MPPVDNTFKNRWEKKLGRKGFNYAKWILCKPWKVKRLMVKNAHYGF
jgi:hypothetical protein